MMFMLSELLFLV